MNGVYYPNEPVLCLVKLLFGYWIFCPNNVRKFFAKVKKHRDSQDPIYEFTVEHVTQIYGSNYRPVFFTKYKNSPICDWLQNRKIDRQIVLKVAQSAINRPIWQA